MPEPKKINDAGDRRSLAEYAITLVDVGGTKTLALVVGLDRNKELLEDVVLARTRFETPVGKREDFFDAMSAQISQLRGQTPKDVKLLPLVGYGTPGRLVNGIIAPGSAANLGNTQHEFDGANPKAELEKRLGIKVFTGNDAVAQMGYGIKKILENPDIRHLFLGQKVCYIGPGTGLGGGFARIADDGSVEFMTDGHIYDIVIPGYSKVVKTQFRVRNDIIEHEFPYERAHAEDLLSGRAVGEMMRGIDSQRIKHGQAPIFLPYAKIMRGERQISMREATDEEIRRALTEKDSPVNARLLNQDILGATGVEKHAKGLAEQIGRFEGGILGRLVECVHNANITKSIQQAQWSSDDAEKVRGTTNYIIGGTVGTTGALGEIVRKTAQEYLKRAIPDRKFNIHPITGSTAESGAIGTSTFIPKNEIDEQTREK